MSFTATKGFINIRSAYKLILVLVLFFYFTDANAQLKQQLKDWRAPLDTATRNQYIYRDRHTFLAFVFLSRYNNSILYNGGKNLYYIPISPVNFGIGFSHKLITLGVSIISPYLNPSLSSEVQSFGFQINGYGKRFGIDMYYLANKGYRLDNHKATWQSFGGTTGKPEFPDMGMIKTGINFIWIANPNKYSLKACTNLMEKQKRSAGSFMINLDFGYSQITNGDSTFVPHHLQADFTNNVKLTDGYFFSICPIPGYGYNWRIMKRFFYDISLCVGPGFQYQNYFDEDNYRSKVAVSYLATIRTAIGFNHKKWVVSLNWIGTAENYPLENKTTFINHVGKIALKIGFRFGLPRWANSYSDKLDNIEDGIERHLPK